MNTLEEITNEEMLEVDGGMAPAAIYALGFVMGMSPTGALAVCGVTVAAGIAVAIKCH